MTNKNNSLQLGRFSNTMDIHSNRSTNFFESSSEMVKLPALRAINKSVKYNDLSFATTPALRKLHKQPQQPQNIEQSSAHHSLLAVRKKYDNMNKMREELELKVQNLQKQQEKLEAEKNRFESQKQLGSSTISGSGNGLQLIKSKLQQAEVEKKVMLHLADRHKWDKVVYDLRKYKQQKELKQLRKKIKIINQQYEKQKGEDDRTEKFKQKYMNHLQAEQSQRNEHMNIVAGILEEKATLLETNEKRIQQLKQISEIAHQEKDYKQKNWYKVYLCQKFVQKLLRDKMNREMIKFNTVQTAFKHIKTSTGVNNAEVLVKRYLNKETAYGQLLGKIAQNQRSISQLKTQSEDLKKERRKLDMEQQVLSSNKKQHFDMTKQEKQMNYFGQRSKLCQSYVQRLKQWLIRTLNKFQVWQGNKKQISSNFSSQNDIKSLFEQYQAYLLKSLDRIGDIQEKGKNLGLVQHQNNYRIGFEDRVEHQDKNAKNVKQNDESDYVNNQRRQLIKNNEKYMKQVRKKYEDLKKAQIQAEPKKRQIIVQKPKPPVVEG